MAISNFYPILNATYSVLPNVVQQVTNNPVASITTLFVASIAFLYNWNRQVVPPVDVVPPGHVYPVQFKAEPARDTTNYEIDLAIELLSQNNEKAFKLREKFKDEGFIKLSRQEYPLHRSVIIQNLGQKRGRATNSIFTKSNITSDNIPVIGIDSFALVPGSNGKIGEGGEKIHKYGLNEKGEKLVKGRFLKFPQNFSEMNEISKEVRSLPNVMFGFLSKMQTKRGVEAFLFAPYAESDLEKELTKGTLTEEKKVIYTLQMLEGVLGLHRKDIFHRDLKPSNIAILNGEICVADFDYATKQISIDQAGTPMYQAPESANESRWVKAHSAEDAFMKLDVYSMGIILYEIFKGAHPWNIPDNVPLSIKNYNSLIAMTTIQFELSFPKPAADASEIEHLIWKMKHIDPDVRPTTEEVIAKVKEIYPNINY